jgi:hypothetical protein
LLLEVKKMLVRRAYEQGRILDPEELTDEALFQLLHEDNNICVLATREIENRAYVRAKPTFEEIERERERDARLGLTHTAPEEKSTSPASNGAQKAVNQEDLYWERHDESVERYAPPQQETEPNQSQPGRSAVS